MTIGRRYFWWALPYGVHALADGSKVYFDRKYRALAQVRPDGTVGLKDPSTKLEWLPATFFYNDTTTPYRRATKLRELRTLADELGLMAHIKKRVRVDYEEYCANIHRKPRRTRTLE